MKIKDLTDNYGHPLYPYLLKSSECDPEQEVKPGDMILIETIRQGTIKRYAKITKGNTPTSWKQVEVKEEDWEGCLADSHPPQTPPTRKVGFFS